jgi:hypothetical protein
MPKPFLISAIVLTNPATTGHIQISAFGATADGMGNRKHVFG